MVDLNFSEAKFVWARWVYILRDASLPNTTEISVIVWPQGLCPWPVAAAHAAYHFELLQFQDTSLYFEYAKWFEGSIA